jgi:MoaA/NifB/PqqE/SkfB family radical SAM enzyme
MILPNYPFRIEFELLSTCNLDCVYCYAKPFSNFTPSFDNISYLFKKTAEVKPFEVVLLGGEPFIRKDVLDIIEFANDTFKHGVGISTNGTMLKRLSEEDLSRLKLLINEGKNNIQVSIDSLNSNINDSIRGKTLESLKGIKTLDENGIQFSVGIVLTKANKTDVSSTINALLSDFKNLRGINLEPLQPTLTLGSSYKNLKLNFNEMVKIYKEALSIRNNKARNIVRIDGVIDSCYNNKTTPLLNEYKFGKCTAGLLRSGVLVNGDVTPCLTIRDEVLGNLYSESWEAIWARSKERYLSLEMEGGQCKLNLLRTEQKEKLKSLSRG